MTQTIRTRLRSNRSKQRRVVNYLALKHKRLLRQRGVGLQIAVVITDGPYDDDLDQWTIGTDTPDVGAWHWARFADGTTGVTADGAGGWSSTPQQSGTLAVGASGASLVIPENGTLGTAYELFIYQRVNGVDSNVLTTGYLAGAPVEAHSVSLLTSGLIDTSGEVPVTVSLPTTLDGQPIPVGSKLLLIDVGRAIKTATVGGNAVDGIWAFNTSSGVRRVSGVLYTITGTETDLDLLISDAFTLNASSWLQAFIIQGNVDISFVGQSEFSTTVSTTHTFLNAGSLVTGLFAVDEWADVSSPDATLLDVEDTTSRTGATLALLDVAPGTHTITAVSASTQSVGTVTAIIEESS